MNEMVPVDPPRRRRRYEIKYYKVVPGGVQPCDMMAWAEQFGAGEHFIAKTVLGNGYVGVSTICLGFDIMCGLYGEQQLFESAVIWHLKARGGIDVDRGIEVMDRYATYEEAMKGHEVIVAEVLKKVGGFLR